MDRRTELLTKPVLTPDERLELTFGSAEALQRARLKSAIRAAERELKTRGLGRSRHDYLTRMRALWFDELMALSPPQMPPQLKAAAE